MSAIMGSLTRAREWFRANPGAALTYPELIERFGFSNEACAQQGVYMLHLEGVAESVRVVRACNTKPAPSQQDIVDELSVLTARQVQVLVHTAKGFSSAETARMLGISLETVYTHREGLLGRLKCSMEEAIVLAAKAGWV
jgi:DNA-binding CsgD family transcriptional regulator